MWTVKTNMSRIVYKKFAMETKDTYNKKITSKNMLRKLIKLVIKDKNKTLKMQDRKKYLLKPNKKNN